MNSKELCEFNISSLRYHLLKLKLIEELPVHYMLANESYTIIVSNTDMLFVRRLNDGKNYYIRVDAICNDLVVYSSKYGGVSFKDIRNGYLATKVYPKLSIVVDDLCDIEFKYMNTIFSLANLDDYLKDAISMTLIVKLRFRVFDKNFTCVITPSGISCVDFFETSSIWNDLV